MRVTQSMLSNNLLKNLNTSYNKLSKLQQQIESGSVISRPSDDPVVALKGMSNRNSLDEVKQYTRNIRDAKSWLDSSDDSLGSVGEALTRVKELLVQASNDTFTSEDRQKMQAEIQQIRGQVQDLANTKLGDDYIFSGTFTNEPLYKNGQLNSVITNDGVARPIKINIFDGIDMQINSNASDIFQQVDQLLAQVDSEMSSGAKGEVFSELIGDGLTGGLSSVFERVLTERANLGARQNRVELMENRLSLREVNVTKQLSENEDTDFARAITEMTTAESIHQASLSVGSKIIQQTLVDFIR